MAYQKQTFVSKQVLKASHLNHIEDGIEELDNNKQGTLISGTNIKTVNGKSLLGSGNIVIEGSGSSGEDGYTPQKGVDYWTEADKQEIKSYVDEAILNGAW